MSRSALSPTSWVPVVPVALLMALVLLPPFAGPELREAVMHGFSRVCHQMPSRSFAIAGTPLALCHRCTGIAAGLLLAAFLLPLAPSLARRLSDEAPVALALGALPVAVDWGGDAVGWWTNTPGSRVVTGLILGLVVGVLLARALRQLTAPKVSTRSVTHPT